MKDGKRAPRAGELFRNPGLAKTYRLLAQKGKKGFYEGKVAQAIVDVVQTNGGLLSLDDLKSHAESGSQDTEPISLRFKGQNVGRLDDGPSAPPQDGMDRETAAGVDVWEHPPNGQGLVALIALGILEELERAGRVPKFAPHEHNSVAYLHALIECLRIAFGDGVWWVADQDASPAPLERLLSRAYLSERAKLFDPKIASPLKVPDHGAPSLRDSDTVYLAVTDKEGNGASFINSVYGGFGSAMVPKGCGFTLQNRGAGFKLEEGHPNVYAPGKRPYHTIIPAMLTNPPEDEVSDGAAGAGEESKAGAVGSLHTVLGVMGGFMQPQGHVQVLLNLLAFGMTPQVALDAPRFCIGAGTPDVGETLGRTVHLEEGIGEDVVKGLVALKHEVKVVTGAGRGLFGRGQVIRCHEEDGEMVYSAGSDPRGDGAAVPMSGHA